MNDNKITPDEKAKKLAKTNTILIVILTILLTTIILVGVYLLCSKVISKKSNNIESSQYESSNNINEEEKENADKPKEPEKPKIEELELDKSAVNAMLIDQGFDLPLRMILNFDTDDLKYDTNIFEDPYNKYILTLYLMNADKSAQDKIARRTTEFGHAMVAIKKTDIVDYSEKVFLDPLTVKELEKINTEVHRSIDGSMESSFPSGIGLNPYLIKARKLVRDNTTYKRTLYADFLSPKDKVDKEEKLSLIADPKVLKWDEKLNYAKVEIEYVKKNNKNYLMSLKFKK